MLVDLFLWLDVVRKYKHCDTIDKNHNIVEEYFCMSQVLVLSKWSAYFYFLQFYLFTMNYVLSQRPLVVGFHSAE